MDKIFRESPVAFDKKPLKEETRDGWRVVLEYVGEGSGPYLVDLSHRPKLDIQSIDLSKFTPFNSAIPDQPGECRLQEGILINRMNGSQAAVWCVGGADSIDLPDESAYTETTDATCSLALLGPHVFDIAEKLSNLDFRDPAKEPPFLLQGPFSHVPCQLATLNRIPELEGIVFTCSRGYANDMVHAIIDAGEEFGLQPAGETRFLKWLGDLPA